MKTTVKGLNDEDKAIIRGIAKKNNMSIAELAKMLMRSGSASFWHQLVVSEEEYNILYAKSRAPYGALSAYCAAAVAYYVDNGMKDIVWSEVGKDNHGKLTKKIMVFYRNESDYLMCLETAKKYGTTSAKLIRWCISNFKNNFED